MFFSKTRGVAPRTQIKPIYSGEDIKQKLLKNPSQIIFKLIYIYLKTRLLGKRKLETGLQGEK
jgi:hypothetical protein